MNKEVCEICKKEMGGFELQIICCICKKSLCFNCSVEGDYNWYCIADYKVLTAKVISKLSSYS